MFVVEEKITEVALSILKDKQDALARGDMDQVKIHWSKIAGLFDTARALVGPEFNNRLLDILADADKSSKAAGTDAR